MKKIWILSLLALVLFSCKKDDDSVEKGDIQSTKVVKSIFRYNESEGREKGYVEYEFNDQGELVKHNYNPWLSIEFSYNEQGNLAIVTSKDSAKKEKIIKELTYADNFLVDIKEKHFLGETDFYEFDLKIEYFDNYVEIIELEGFSRLYFDTQNRFVSRFRYLHKDENGNPVQEVAVPLFFNYDSLGNLISYELKDFKNRNYLIDFEGETILRTKREYTYDTTKPNIFDSLISLKNKVGVYNLNAFVSLSFRFNYFDFSETSNNALMSYYLSNNVPSGTVTRELLYNADDVLTKVIENKPSFENTDGVKVVYEIEYYE